MNRSVNPFVAGWYGADLKCLIPLRLINVANSSDENLLPLSDTICAGIPLRENIDPRTSIVFVDVVVFISTISGHFEWASTNTKNILSRNGPAKSMCTLSHGEEGHSQGCNGAMASIFWVSDIQNTVLLTSRCRYQFPATKQQRTNDGQQSNQY